MQDARLEQLDDVAQDRGDVEALHAPTVVARERDEPACVAVTRVDRLLDGPERPTDGLGKAGLAAQRRDVQADRLEDVAELVCHLAGKLTERRQVLRLAEAGGRVADRPVPLVGRPRLLGRLPGLVRGDDEEAARGTAAQRQRADG